MTRFPWPIHRFTASDKTDAGIPVWKDPETISYAKDIFKYLLIAAIVAFLYLKIIQPSLKTMFPPHPEGASLDTVEGVAGTVGHVRISGEEGDEGDDIVHIDHYAIKVQKVRDIAQADSKAVANIIRDWMGVNAS